MYILTIRTDQPEAEIGVFNGQTQLAYETWQAHRQLAETIHQKIAELLGRADIELHQLQGVVAYKGPGSFTGLRIGLSVANALAHSLNASIVATNGDDWQHLGIAKLLDGQSEAIALPEYGSDPHITKPKH